MVLLLTGRKLVEKWRADRSITGSPTVGGGAVWTLDTEAGTLFALSTDDGKVRARRDVGPVSRFSTPVPAGNRVYVATIRGVTALTIR
jgi:hypothetical protein